jgi:hypothetical protein
MSYKAYSPFFRIFAGASAQLFAHSGITALCAFRKSAGSCKQLVADICLSAWHFSRYELVATNYSKPGRMTPQGLHCSIVTDQGMTVRQYPAGLPATCDEWKISELHVS